MDSRYHSACVIHDVLIHVLKPDSANYEISVIFYLL